MPPAPSLVAGARVILNNHSGRLISPARLQDSDYSGHCIGEIALCPYPLSIGAWAVNLTPAGDQQLVGLVEGSNVCVSTVYTLHSTHAGLMPKT